MSSLSNNHNMETKKLLDELSGFNKGGLFDFGHPLLNRIAESFVKAAGIGAVQAVSREAYFTLVEGTVVDGSVRSEITSGKKSPFPDLRGMGNQQQVSGSIGEEYRKRISAVGIGCWNVLGLTYGLKEARGTHDWKNSAVAGAITGMALALTTDDSSHEQMVQSAITGAAISTTAHLLAGIF